MSAGRRLSSLSFQPATEATDEAGTAQVEAAKFTGEHPYLRLLDIGGEKGPG